MKIKDQHFFPINLKTKYLVIGLISFAFIVFFLNNSNSSNNDEDLNFNRRFGGGGLRNVDVINLNELFHIGDCLLKQSADRIVKIRIDSLNNKQMDFDHKKDDDSVVTTADLESHNIIVHSLKDKFKNLVVKSEENTNDNFFDSSIYLRKCDTYEKKPDDKYAPVSDLIVYIDPLDATQEYSENLVDYVTVMFCLVDKGVPKAGILIFRFD
jgi:inositol monophosphatase 3